MPLFSLYQARLKLASSLLASPHHRGATSPSPPSHSAAIASTVSVWSFLLRSCTAPVSDSHATVRAIACCI